MQNDIVEQGSDFVHSADLIPKLLLHFLVRNNGHHGGPTFERLLISDVRCLSNVWIPNTSVNEFIHIYLGLFRIFVRDDRHFWIS